MLRLWTLALIVTALSACAPQVGDSCEQSTDCGRELACDLGQPDGYCTITPCEVNGCPSESVCIRFPNDDRYCMLRCEESSDCRDNYVCVQEYGDAPFCNAEEYLK